MCKPVSEKVALVKDQLNGFSRAASIDPEKLQKWVQFILSVLPQILALFASPSPSPSPAPVQAGAPITTIDGLMEYVEKTIELHSLSEEQQQKVLAAVEALASFLTM